jgi:arginase
VIGNRSSERRISQLVIGGDCSILPGALAGAREAGPLSLLHIDGHGDFHHPGNYDSEQNLGAVAGMDLALATGRGKSLATQWPGIARPLVADGDVIPLGERENRNTDFAWPDISSTAITRINVFEALTIGPAVVTGRIREALDRTPDQGFWIHLDVDVLDQSVMPAADSPGSPGIPTGDLLTITAPLIANPRSRGMTVTVFDPDLDPDGRFAAVIVELLAQWPFPRQAAAFDHSCPKRSAADNQRGTSPLWAGNL